MPLEATLIPPETRGDEGLRPVPGRDAPGRAGAPRDLPPSEGAPGEASPWEPREARGSARRRTEGPLCAHHGPRDRLLTAGAAALATSELIALLLGTDGDARAAADGAPVRSSEAALRDLLDREGGLRSLASRTPEELRRLAGLGPSRAARLLASVEIGRRLAAEPLARGVPIRASGDVFRHYHPFLRDLRVEQFRVVLLDGKHRVLREVLVSQGTLTSSPVHPREVFAPAIRHHAAAAILVHNHPSGDPSPSADDLEITRRLADVGDLVGIRIVDHVVVGDGAFASFADRGLLPG